MINYNTLINKPIISLYESRSYGISTKAYLNNRKKFKFIELIKDEEEYVIAIKDIIKHSTDSLVIRNSKPIQLKSNLSLMLEECYNIMSGRVYDIDGNSLGNIIDIDMDDKFNLISIKLDNNTVYDKKHIFNISNELIIVNTTTKTTYNKYKPKSIPKEKVEYKDIVVKALHKPTPSSTNNSDITPSLNKNEQYTKEINNISPIKATDINTLLNREATKTIIYTNGEVIVRKGAKITREIIKKARVLGKLYELVKYSK